MLSIETKINANRINKNKDKNSSLTCDAALARLSNALVIADVVSVFILQSICKLVVVLDEVDEGGERYTAEMRTKQQTNRK